MVAAIVTARAYQRFETESVSLPGQRVAIMNWTLLCLIQLDLAENALSCSLREAQSILYMV